MPTAPITPVLTAPSPTEMGPVMPLPTGKGIVPVIGYGNQKEGADRPITVAICCNCEFRMDDREMMASIPIYEIPLALARYSFGGGFVKPVAYWPGGNARGVPLSRNQMHEEMMRLSRAYVIPSQSSPIRFFDKIYGVGSDMRFYKVHNDMLKAWRAMEARVAKEGRKLRDDDIEPIILMSRPQVIEVEPEFFDGGIPSVNPKAETEILPPVDPDEITDHDPITRLVAGLNAMGNDPNMVLEVAAIVGAGRQLTKDSIAPLFSAGGQLKGAMPKMLADLETLGFLNVSIPVPG